METQDIHHNLEAIKSIALHYAEEHLGWDFNRLRIEPRRVEKAPGRNESCPYGSEKKYKKYCL